MSTYRVMRRNKYNGGTVECADYQAPSASLAIVIHKARTRSPLGADWGYIAPMVWPDGRLTFDE